MALEHSLSDSNAHQTSKAIVSSLVGITVHSTLCPLHGLPMVLANAGAISSSTLGPLYLAHDYLLEKVEGITEQVIDDPVLAHHVAHKTLDYTGLGLGVGLPLAYIGYNLYRRFRK